MTGSPVRFLQMAGRVARWHLVLAVGLTAAVGLTEGVGVVLLVGLLSLTGLDFGPVAGAARAAGRLLEAGGVAPSLISMLALYVLATAARAALQHWQTLSAQAVQTGLTLTLRRQLYRALVHADWAFVSRHRVADLTHVLTGEMTRVGIATRHLLLMVAHAVIAALYLALALWVSPGMTVVLGITGLGLLVCLRNRARATRTTAEEGAEANRELHAAALEHLAGIKVVKAYGAEDRTVDLLGRLTARLAMAQRQVVAHQAATRRWFEVGGALALGALVYLSLEGLGLTPGALLLLLFLYARTMPRLAALEQSYQQFVAASPALDTVVDTTRRSEAARAQAASASPVALQREIRLEGVRVGYAPDRAPALADLDLTVRAGETTAVVGFSGAGKSTLADVVMGFLEPDAGVVLVDGVALGPERRADWRRRIGYVPQEPFLFHGTVRENLAWARPEATEAEMGAALRHADADEFVARLPAGLDTPIGERGTRLSSGERQRLALAQALLRQPSLLVLDEATSALDAESEARILAAIGALPRRLTVLIVTHRLAAARRADVVHVLEAGRVVETGPWERLVASNGRLRALWDAQDPGAPGALPARRGAPVARATGGGAVGRPSRPPAVSGGSRSAAGARPAATVIVLAYDAAATVGRALASLQRQRGGGTFEIVVVWSGDPRTARIVARDFPDVRLVGRPGRLPTGAARNLGIAQARGEVIAFLAADCEAEPEWLSRRLASHREGFDCVGGAVVCAEPAGPVARASHFLEYTLCASGRPREVVSGQPIYNLSFRREIFERYGTYEPALACGEDTFFNWRLVRAGERLLFEPGIRMVHPGPRRLGEYLRHQVWHGRWFARLCRYHGYPGTPATNVAGRARLAWRYPLVRALRLTQRVLRWQRDRLGEFVLLCPLIGLGILAATVGIVRGWSEPESAP